MVSQTTPPGIGLTASKVDNMADESILVSYPGKGQYSVGGSSACGLAAMNCARLVLSKVGETQEETSLVAITSRETMEDILSICVHWTNPVHLDVEDIVQVPFFSSALTLLATRYAYPRREEFTHLLQHLSSIFSSASCIITRPPETIALLSLKFTHGPTTFVIFDSHSRPSHPDGAAFIITKSTETVAAHLDDLFHVDPRLLADPNLQWQAQLLANFSAHIFVYNDARINTHDALLESSIAVLALKAGIADLKSTNVSFASENKRLEQELEESDEALRDARRQIRQLRAASLQSQVPTQKPCSETCLMQHEPESSMRQPRLNAQASSSKPNRSNPSFTAATQGESPSAFSSTAMRAHQEYTAEHVRLVAERQALLDANPIFTCGICLDDTSTEAIAVPSGCDHPFCRHCLKSYVLSKLQEQRYPLICPTCAANSKADDNRQGAITAILASQLGLSQKQFELFDELEMSSIAIPLYCRKCQQSVLVDKAEHDQQRILVCPLRGCKYAWCKQCQQEVIMENDTVGQHSCDGSKELESLMKTQGWRHCPGCKTPIQKEEGCNHMTCSSPGCNAHFCYKCGELIVKSMFAHEIKTATTAHYRICTLFEH